MYRPSAPGRLAAAAVIAALAVGSAPAAVQASQGPASVRRYNVAGAHSPQLERILAHAAARRPGPASPAASTPAVKGIDLASEQHPGGAAIGWAQVAGAGYKFAFIKVSEGSYYANPYYPADATGAKAAGLLVAPYAFAIPNYSGGAFQADYALDRTRVMADGHTLPLIADLEYDPYSGTDGTPAGSWCYGLTPGQMVAWIAAFSAETHRRTGRSAVIYTTAQWWDKCTGGSTAFGAQPLWIAGPGQSPPMPPGWTGWTYWQYTSSATVPGISVATDASYLSASALELAEPASQSYRAGARVTLTVSALDGGRPVSFAAAGLPAGLSIGSSAGVISGTLTARVATFRSLITVTAPGAPKAVTGIAWEVHGKVRLARLRARSGSVGTPLAVRIAASDALAGCTLRVTAAGLPPGLAMDSCGLVTGWPSVSGHYRVSVRVTDSSGGALATGSFGWSIGSASGRGPSGPITLSRNGKCLAALSAADIAIQACGGTAAQLWTVAANGALRNNGRCLTATAGVLTVSGCSHGGQRWEPGPGGALRNLSAGRCLADGSATGSRAVAAACYATPNSTGSASTPGMSQRWMLPAGPLTSGIAGLCASGWHRDGRKPGPVALRRCNTSRAQDWAVEPDGTIRASGLCLSLNSGATGAGTTARLAACRGSGTQAWQLLGGPIGMELYSPAAGLCLADPGDRAATGTALALGYCAAADPGISWRVS